MGANLQARQKQKEAEQALGPEFKRRRGDLFSGTNKGVSSRHIADLEKELVSLLCVCMPRCCTPHMRSLCETLQPLQQH